MPLRFMTTCEKCKKNKNYLEKEHYKHVNIHLWWHVGICKKIWMIRKKLHNKHDNIDLWQYESDK
jgi:hypothetical protein